MSTIPPPPGEDDFTRPSGNVPPPPPPPSQGGYPPPLYGADGGMPPPRPGSYPALDRNQKAIFSMVLGIISIFCMGFILGIVAIVLGILARREIAASRGLQSGSGFAIAGIVTGVLGIVSSTVVFLTGFQLDVTGLF